VDQPKSFPQLIGVLDTEDNFALSLATVALVEAGIIYYLADIPAGPANVEKPKWWIPPCRILVAIEDAGEARSLLELCQQPATPGEIDKLSK
jgi:hypothetical protein